MILRNRCAMFIIISSVIIVVCCIINICYSNLISHNYNRAVYSVVIHNKTSIVLDNIQVFYGYDINEENSTSLFGIINNLNPNEYKKINIPTNCPNKSVKPPYNVWVSVRTMGMTKNYPAGYFGIDTGGLAVFEAEMDNHKLNFQRVYQHEKKYKRIHKRNKKNQLELSWYD